MVIGVSGVHSVIRLTKSDDHVAKVQCNQVWIQANLGATMSWALIKAVIKLDDHNHWFKIMSLVDKN